MHFAKEMDFCGYVVIRQFLPCVSSFDAFTRLGIVDHVEGLTRVHALKPYRRDEARPNTYSGHFGTDEFPLHTDLAHWSVPPRFLALRCIRGTDRVTSRVWDGNALIETIGVELLRRAVVQPRRPLRYGKQLLRLLEHNPKTDEYILRWDHLFLRPATPLTEKIFNDSLCCLSTVTGKEVTLVDIGDTLVIDNWRMLHGRSAIPISGCDRHIDRCYLEEVL